MTISGGPVFWLLVALAVAAVVIFFERFFELRRVQIDWQDFVKGVINVLGGGNAEEALAIIGQISPLIGLLGTIIGFIKTVLLVNSQELVARADLINSSMEALLSAALGLCVAIPVAVMYGVLRVRMERIVVEMEAAASQITGYIATREAKK